MKWLKLLWQYVQSKEFRVFVGDILDVYVSLVKEEISPEEALEKIKALAVAFIENFLKKL